MANDDKPSTEHRRQNRERSEHEARRGVKKTSPPLSNLSRTLLDEVEIAAAIASLENETDRGAGIIGAAIVEEAATQLLKAVLQNIDDLVSVFENPGAPFSSLAQKTIGLYAMGFSNKQIRKDMDTIRAIRNQFSHSLRPIDFNNSIIKAACDKLTDYPTYDLKVFFKPGGGGARRKYESACFHVATALFLTACDALSKRNADLIQRIADLESARDKRSS